MDPETQYILDGGILFNHISPEIYPYLSISKDSPRKIFDESVDHPESEYNFHSNIQRFYENWRKNTDYLNRAHVTFAAIFEYEQVLKENIGSITNSLVDCYLYSNYGIKSILLDVQPTCIQNLFVKEIDDIKNIEYLLNHSKHQENFYNNIHSFYSRLKKDMNEVDSLDTLLERMESNIKEIRNQSLSLEDELQFSDNLQKIIPSKKELKKRDKETRKAITRSCNLFEKTIGKKELKDFVHDNGFIIEGKYYNYHISKNDIDTIYQRTYNTNVIHTPYNIFLYTKDGKYYSSCCIYFKNTPILDQIVSLFMSIRTEEELILETGNFFNYNPEFLSETETFNENLFLDGVIGLERDDTNRRNYLVNLYYETIKENLFSLLDVPYNLLEFMYNPTIQFDQIIERSSKKELRELKGLINKDNIKGEIHEISTS